MKVKHFCQLSLAIMLVILIASVVTADDGLMFRRNISDTPDGETEDALIGMMEFYVPAQTADGTLLESLEYYAADGTLYDTRYEAKPLFASYIDDVGEADGQMVIMSGLGFGHRDAFVAYSLDDGATWNDMNLSGSAEKSSFTLANGTAYPGDVFSAVSAVAGDRVMAAWVSRYCDGGRPAYTMVDDEGEPLYPDLFGVAGTQDSVDYTQQGFPEVGEVPFGCVWTARGQLILDEDTGSYDVLWRQAERLTSGRRDANRVEIAADTGAGFIITWQEDPEGLRPGQGLGPGEGWSGAVVNAQTDIWYSYIGYDDFRLVLDADGNVIDPDLYEGDEKPWPGVPMAIPVRLTDNAMCRYVADPTSSGADDPYCYEDFDLNGTSDFCAQSISWTNPGGTTLSICQSEDERVLWGRVGASRARIGLIPYTNAEGFTSGWVVMAYEESKAMGDVEDPENPEDPIEIGKNIWYHTFDMYSPEIVSRGHILNQPAVDPETGEFFDLIVSEYEFIDDLYETEIARRFSMIVQEPEYAGPSGTVLFALFKQGIINQGGPADIFARRFVLPDDFDPQVDNPYLFDNMVCNEWGFTDADYNTNYPGGICLDPAINVSGVSFVSCAEGDCPPVTTWEDLETPPTPMPRVTEWIQTTDNLIQQSWDNPYDVAKGHRGFLDGDFLMVMYAWSPNWKANSVGNDKYNLYLRRSFDGGVTWTTTPAILGGDGATHCENYLTGEQICTDYPAGEFEQARNVSQLTGTKVTILDPRYSPAYDSICETVGDDGACTSYLYPDDEHDPSRFFIVYETGDNTTVAVGEATPLDLFYSRGTTYGDDYYEVEYQTSGGEVILGWDWLEKKQDDLSGEASIVANPGGNFLYAVWNQWQEPAEDVIENSDAWFRRVMFIDDMDIAPIATGVWYSPHAVNLSAGGDISFAGMAKDNDQLGAGIVAHRWSSSIDGLLNDQKMFSIPVQSLSPGLHIIRFSAKDNEGNWANDLEFYLLVAEELHQTYLPTVPGD